MRLIIDIPDNATNGDVMKIIFPQIGVYDEWNDEPYQKEELSQKCVGSTQKHVGNALDMRCDECRNKRTSFCGNCKGYDEFEPCDDEEQIDYHDDFETALRKIYDYEERQKQNDKRCGNCKLIGTDSCYMVCGGSKSLYKPKQKSEPCDDAISREATLEPYKGLNEEDTISVWLIRKNIEQQPSVNPQPICEEREKGECPYYAG